MNIAAIDRAKERRGEMNITKESMSKEAETIDTFEEEKDNSLFEMFSDMVRAQITMRTEGIF